MLKHFLDLLRIEFGTQIARKTGWGKNEIMQEFERAISSALTQLLEEPGDISLENAFIRSPGDDLSGGL